MNRQQLGDEIVYCSLTFVGAISFMLLIFTLAACSPKVITQDRPVRVAVPVPAPCTSAKPAPVTPLRDSSPQWDDLDVRQKAALVSKQAIELRTYGEQLHAATAACP